MSPASCTETWRGEGAKTNPTADAPRLTASSASASEVMPQILTNRSLAHRAPTGARPAARSWAGRSAARTSVSPTRMAS